MQWRMPRGAVLPESSISHTFRLAADQNWSAAFFVFVCAHAGDARIIAAQTISWGKLATWLLIGAKHTQRRLFTAARV